MSALFSNLLEPQLLKCTSGVLVNRWISFEFNTFGALYSNPMVLLKFYSRPRSAVIGQYLAHMSTIGELTPEGTEKRGINQQQEDQQLHP